MIVKNEEDWIEGALESVRSAVDEIIIADTGCTDSTMRRAARFSPKVLTFQWPGDFAEARNRTLAEARHPWILVLDADERIAARDLPLLTAAINKGCDGYHLVQRNYVYSNQVFGWSPNDGSYPEGNPYAGYVDNPLIRLFRNARELRFHGAVHEIIDPKRLPARFRFGSLSIPIHHYGKVRERERVAAKQRLYLELGIKKAIGEPENAKAWFDLGIQYQELNQHSEAAECFEKAHSLSHLPVTLLYGAISRKHLGAHIEALALLEHALASGLDTFDVHLEMGNIQMVLGRLQEAIGEYDVCLKLNRGNPVALFNCGLAWRKLGDLQSAESYFGKALRADATFALAAIELASVLETHGRYAEAAALLHPVIEREPDHRPARLTLARICIHSNQCDAALSLLENTAPDDALAQSLAGAAYLQAGNVDKAQEYLERALKQDRSLIDARINLALIYERKGERGRAERYRASAAMALK